jgi:hypothetical protein
MSLVAGLILACGTTFLSALGLTLQKRAHAVLQRSAPPRPRSYKSPSWLAGLACIITSALASLGVSALLGQFLASSFACLTLVWAAGLRHFALGETLTTYDYTEIALLVAGTLAIVLGRGMLGDSPLVPPLLSPGALLALLDSWRTALFAAGWGLAFGALWTSSWRPWCRLGCLITLAALCGGLTGVASKAVGSLLAFAVGGGSGAPGEVAGSFLLWVSLAILLASVALQLGFLNQSLKEGAAGVCVPAYQAAFLLCGLASGLILWREDAVLRPPAAAACVAAGVALILVGLFVVVKKGAATSAAPPPPPPPAPPLLRRAQAGAAPLRRRSSPRRTVSSPAALGHAAGPGAPGGGAAGAACAAADSLPEGLRQRRAVAAGGS